MNFMRPQRTRTAFLSSIDNLTVVRASERTNANDDVAEDAVLREPVSTLNSQLTGKNTGKFHETSESEDYSLPKVIVKSAISAKFLTPKNRECPAA